MFLEICMRIHSVVFALSRQINKQKVCENNLLCKVNKVFVKYQAQGGGVNTRTPPCVRPWIQYSPLSTISNMKRFIREMLAPFCVHRLFLVPMFQ